VGLRRVWEADGEGLEGGFGVWDVVCVDGVFMGGFDGGHAMDG